MKSFSKLAVFLCLLLLALPTLAQADPKPDLDPMELSCAGSTEATITLTVKAGASGAPAGFSIQWMTAADYVLYGWSQDASSYCGASFSGNASGNYYALGAEGERTITLVGENFYQYPGASTSCDADLECGTAYVFRAFAHGNSDFNRSAFSSTLQCSTAACEDGCTYSQGYWKNHSAAWPVASLTLGDTSYTKAQLLAILNTPPAKGNGLISLAHQLIAAKLNVANGADDSSIAAAIAAADAMIGSLVIPPSGSGYLPSSTTSALAGQLESFNVGTTGPGHCG